MRVLIVYASQYGGTAECAHDLKQYIDIPSDVLPVTDPAIMLSDYDIIIAGGAIHAGSLQRSLKKFLKNNTDLLLNKKFAYFICCLMPEHYAVKQVLPKNIPRPLMEHAFASAYPGATVDYGKMNWVERIILKRVTGSRNSFCRKDEDRLKEFASVINRQ